MPTLQQMRYLTALAETLHFRRAAEKANVTQPTLSAQIKEMESRLGAALVERSRSRVILTPVGAEVARRATRILSEVEDIRTLARRAVPLAGTIRVGIAPSLGSYLLARIVPDLHDSHPALKLYIREALPDTLIAQLEDGVLDMLFFPLPLDRAELECVPLFSEPLRLVMPHDHPLAARDSVPRTALRGETVLTLEPGHRMAEQVAAIAREAGATVSTDYEGTSLDTLRQMVGLGMGLSILPALYIRSEVAREVIVTDRPLVPEPARLIGMVWRRSSPRAGELRDLSQIVAGILSARAPEVDMRDQGTRVGAPE